MEVDKMSLYTFFNKECESSLGNEVKCESLYSAYYQWCNKLNVNPKNRIMFMDRLTRGGIETKNHNGIGFCLNIKLRNPDNYDFSFDPDQTNVNLFIAKNCARSFEFESKSILLYNAYLKWCFELNVKPYTKSTFVIELEKLGFFQYKKSNGMHIRYIKLNDMPDENSLVKFINEQCSNKPNSQTQSSVLYNAYLKWCYAKKLRTLNTREFKSKLELLNYPAIRQSAGMFYQHIELKNCP